MFKPGTVMYSRAASKIQRRNCESCGVELTAHQGLSNGICDKPACHEWMIEKVGAELIARKRRENAEKVEKMFTKMAPAVEVAAAAIDATPETIIRSKIPYQPAPVIPLPEERKAEFEEHLRGVVESAFAEEISDTDFSYREKLEADLPDVVDTACSACKGGCCAVAGTTAYLEYRDIDRWRQRQPDVTPDEIVDYYVGMLPEEATEDACMFQSATGCVLPRDKRNDQCHTFYCKALKDLSEALSTSEDGKVVFIADEEGEANSITAWSPSTGRVPLEKAARPAAAPSAPQPIVMSSDDFQ
ncbi:MAG: hypothetical protein AAFV19_13510 [Pseudomonadota bacterium]